MFQKRDAAVSKRDLDGPASPKPHCLGFRVSRTDGGKEETSECDCICWPILEADFPIR